MGNLAFSAIDSGLWLHRTGKITLIIALLCMAFFIKEPITAKTYIYKAFRELSRINLLWQTRNWNQVQGKHFVVRFQDQDRNVSDMVLKVAENSYKPVSKGFDYQIGGKTLIVIYPTKESLNRSFGWAADESAMGVYWAGVIRVLSPNDWVDEKDPRKVQEVFSIEGPVAHEFTHLMVDYETGGNYTRWFTEGVAQFEEIRLTGFQMDHRAVTHPEEFYPLAQMDREFDNLDDQNLAYYESYQAVNYMVHKYGEAGLRNVLTNLGRGRTMDQSFKSALGVSMSQFEKDFKNWAVVHQ